MSQTYQALMLAAQHHLETARQALNAEISAYPTPIAGCDAQFNHLLGEREKITDALLSLKRDVFVPTPRSPTPSVGVESR